MAFNDYDLVQGYISLFCISFTHMEWNIHSIGNTFQRKCLSRVIVRSDCSENDFNWMLCIF